MKMPYEKPMMAIERYELTQSIAACAIKIGSMDEFCVSNDPDAPGPMRNWAQEGGFTPECDLNMWEFQEQGEDGICYHTTAGQTATFTS